jgi:pimeloyl-ACP methyl ester carboxylesterase
MPPRSTEPFTRHVTSAGPANGMTFAGRKSVIAGPDTEDLPLVVAIHGGGYTSGYFDVPGYSLLDRACRSGVPIIAIDRPGYGGSTPVAADGSIFLANAAALDHVIAELWEAHGTGAAGVVLIGHSFGAAITMATAARKPTWPLLGIATSGYLLRTPRNLADIYAAVPGLTLESPPDQKAARMLGPRWTLRSDMPEASYAANEPVLKAELIEGTSTWESIFQEIAPDISVPVHHRQGEFDTLTITDGEQIAEFITMLASSPRVDAEIFPAAGHAIDYHRVAAAFQTQQLSFALVCAALRVARSPGSGPSPSHGSGETRSLGGEDFSASGRRRPLLRRSQATTRRSDEPRRGCPRARR